MRKQYFFRPSQGGFLAWDVDRLIALTAAYPRRRVAIAEIKELNEPWFGPDEPVTWAALVEHVKLIDAADLEFPIILAADGAVMDGMHRAAKALKTGRSHLEAVQFSADPPPDYRDVQPADLPYDEAAGGTDWRLQGQERYLTGATLAFGPYRRSRKNPTWDHDHCEFCWATFMVGVGPEALHEGYQTVDDYRWICSTCLEDFRARFDWEVVESRGDS